MDKPITFSEWLGTQGNMVLLHANCCRIAYEVGQQSQQAKVEELQTLYTQQGINMLKMQKRVDALELKLREIAGIARRARHGEYYTESGRNAGLNIAAQIERALKGEG
ncbi:hypothetical protein [Acinetobacter nosocomialis]|uniref:hypothetical protein n=1 Tax=Acinetobacter nosocomialis TaxID=106654 RepID=UPI00102F2B13|nr:hypothetical protein [Acinetobacter nosocomialis]QBF77679.1 hypothetical protein KAN02_06120 [Acinetobacter nosocomialis]